jgi:hypothetical protein
MIEEGEDDGVKEEVLPGWDAMCDEAPVLKNQSPPPE